MKNYKIYIYNDSTQPKNGLFKSCFVCKTITAQTQYFSEKTYQNKNYKYLVFVCPDCKKTILKDTDIRNYYEKKVNEYIFKLRI